MSLRTSPWPVGTPCWADLTAPDVGAARRFYSAVLGWSFDEPDARYGGYATGRVRGAAAGGVGPLPAGGHPAAWTLYFASDDAGATARVINEAGGTVLMGPHEVGDLGRLVIAADPAGAVFGVWQAGQHIGAGIVNEPGGLMWEDLRSTDPDAARAFYSTVFGFATEALEMAGPDYTTFSGTAGEPPLGGMGGMMGAPDGTRSHWLVYFGVADVEAAVGAATGAGGSVVAPPFPTPFGPMAGLADPGGAVFWLGTPNADQVPDRAG